MNDPVTEALMRLVEKSSTPDEMTRRVVQSFGENKLSRARQIAADMKGFECLRQGQNDRPRDTGLEPNRGRSEILRRLRENPSLAALVVGAVVLLMVLVFPPFIVPLPQGLVNNVGFGFVFSPPTQGNLTAVVNTQLLALFVVDVMASTAAIYTVLLRIESTALPKATQ